MERYTQREHFARLANTTELVRGLISESPDLARYRQYLRHDAIWRRRIDDPDSRYLRPLIVRNVAESVTGDAEAWLRSPQILAAVELFNISTYQADTAIEDETFLVRRVPSAELFRRVGLPVSLSVITLSMAHSLLARAALQDDSRRALCSGLMVAAQRVSKGQLEEGINLRRAPRCDPLELSEKEFGRRYLIRCLNLDGFQLAMCVYFGLILGGAKSQESPPTWTSALLRAGIEFGVCLQILNDLEDFYTPDRSLVFRDLQAGRITWFAYVLWRHSSATRGVVEALRGPREANTRCDPYALESSIIIVDQHRDLLAGEAHRLLKKRYNKLRDALVKARPYLKDDGRALDFIFPHIFLSRILRKPTSGRQITNAGADVFTVAHDAKGV